MSINNYNPILPFRLFSKLGAIFIVLGMLGIFRAAQTFGVYMFAPIVFNETEYSGVDLMIEASNNGLVISLAMLFTLVIVAVVSYALIKLRLIRVTTRLAQKNKSRQQTRYQPSRVNDADCKNTYRVADYLQLKPFSLGIGLAVLGIWFIYVLGSQLLTYALNKNPNTFLDSLYFSTPYPLLLIIVIVIAVPIYEEILFRGVMWSVLREQISGPKGVWLASIVTSVLFAAVHLQYDFYSMSTIFVLALILSFARSKSGSLYLPIIIHMINNGLAMLQYIINIA